MKEILLSTLGIVLGAAAVYLTVANLPDVQSPALIASIDEQNRQQQKILDDTLQHLE